MANNDSFLNQYAKKLSAIPSAFGFLTREIIPNNLNNLMGRPNPNSLWNLHDNANYDIAEKTLAQYGGWNRKQRDAKSYLSAYDIGMRAPKDIEGLKLLAALYQGKDAAMSLFSSEDTMKDNYADYRANIKGLEAAQKAVQSGYNDNLLHYSDPFGDTINGR